MSDLYVFVYNLTDRDKSKIVDVLVEKLCKYETEDFVKTFIESMINYVPIVPEKGKSYDYVDIAIVSGVRGY
jgi:hypothetical protein